MAKKKVKKKTKDLGEAIIQPMIDATEKILVRDGVLKEGELARKVKAKKKAKKKTKKNSKIATKKKVSKKKGQKIKVRDGLPKPFRSVKAEVIPAKMGRPTSYRPELCLDIIEHFDIAPYRKIGILEEGEVDNREEKANDFPTLASFAVKIGVSRQSLHEWRDKYPDFSYAMAKCKEFQEEYITVNGMKGLIPPQFTIFVAKNLINYKDKQEIKHEGEVNQNIKVDPIDLDERISQLIEASK